MHKFGVRVTCRCLCFLSKTRAKFAIVFSSICFLTSSCQAGKEPLEPEISYTPPVRWAESLPSAFPALTLEEYRQAWGKELLIAQRFSAELDLYRAITSYKRAFFLIPDKYPERNLQIEYSILQCYYVGKKYPEVIDLFERGPLSSVSDTFPAIHDLLIMVYDSYQKTGQAAKACSILQVLEQWDADTAERLRLSEAVISADFCGIEIFAEATPGVDGLLNTYFARKKSVETAQMLNAFLPGAGYLYVGQTQTAFTSFMINTLFVAAAYHFFEQKNYPAGIIVSSLETGWYLGGIHGAGLAAREINKQLYETQARECLLQGNLFPILMLRYAF